MMKWGLHLAIRWYSSGVNIKLQRPRVFSIRVDAAKSMTAKAVGRAEGQKSDPSVLSSFFSFYIEIFFRNWQ